MTLKPDEVEKNRKSVGWTQKDLAEAAVVGLSTVQKIEQGLIETPSLAIMDKITDAINKEKRDSGIIRFAKDLMIKDVIMFKPNDTIAEVVEKIEDEGISQFPIIENGFSIGTITSRSIHKLQNKMKAYTGDCPVIDAKDDSLPMVNEQTPEAQLSDMLTYNPAVLIVSEGKIVGIVTREDLVRKK